jgi:hypothetical protein
MPWRERKEHAIACSAGSDRHGVTPMDEDGVRKCAEELLRMSGAEFLQHVEDRRRDRKAKIDRILRRACGATFDEKFKNSDDVLKALYADDVATRKLALFALHGPWGQAAGASALPGLKKWH